MNASNAKLTLDIIEKAEYYRLRAHRKARSHYLAARNDQRMNVALGVPVVITTTVVGTAIFANLHNQANSTLQIIVGLVSMAAAVLASLQTFFKYSERAEKQLSAAASYASLFRKLDIFKLKLSEADIQSQSSVIDDLQEIVAQWDQLEKTSPDVPDKFYDQAKREDIKDKEGV